MARATITSNVNIPTSQVIDLTCSDDESASQQVPEYHFKPLSEIPVGEPNREALPDHGLLLDRKFGSFSSWRLGPAPKFTSSRRVNKGTSRLRKTIIKSPAKIHEHNALPNFRGTRGFQENSAKRRRIEIQPSIESFTRKNGGASDHNPHNEQAGLAEKTSPSGLVPGDASSFSFQALEFSPWGQLGDQISKDGMNESLKIALRQQVFPHVNQRLGHYRLLIDNATRRQLGKKAAWEICDEDFMTNLMQNDGRLSATFEMKVASMARSLIDKYAANFVIDSNNARNSPESTEYDFALKKRPKFDNKIQKELKAVSGDALEATRDKKKGRLNAAMKGPWAEGEVHSAVAWKAATLFLKKAGRNSSQYDRGFSKVQKKEALEVLRPSTIAHKSEDSPLPDSDRVDKPRRRLIVKLRIGDALRRHFAQDIQNITSIPRRRQDTKYLAGRDQSARRSVRGFVMKDSKATATVNHRPSTASELRRTTKVQSHQKPAALVIQMETRRQIENLRVAGLDNHVPRPYLNWQHRNDVERGLALIQTSLELNAKYSEVRTLAMQGSTLHVDFCQEEIEFLIPVIESVINKTSPEAAARPTEGIWDLMRGHKRIIPKILTTLSAARRTLRPALFSTRTETAIEAFLQDAAAGISPIRPEIKRIDLRTKVTAESITSPNTIRSILQQREMWGKRRNRGTCVPFKTRLLNGIEDKYIRKIEWTDCSGDIATITWIDSNRFFCGATTHSDEHNMQYNKPGNLLIGNALENSLKSVSGHQIVRPIVTDGENSLEAMRGTQDPWMYCSVTSTAYSHDNRKCFTGSYDQTVKVWDIAEDGFSMNLCGVWSHSGNVNFVVASSSHSLVATAADVREDAVRVYQFDPSNVTASAFSIYEASVQQHNSSDTWAYFPSTMQWGISTSVAHLLLVGYSPRSFNCHDEDIPEDRLNSGELCLWDCRDGSRIPITSARTQNVFEVAWHPTQPIFVAATSPAGVFEDWVKTQLRVFEQNASGSFGHVKTLDCPAIDINEITIMPNSTIDCYVTASCTDGNTYVWDSALSDKPLHTLRHGDSIDEYAHGETREETDIGVKFAAWGNSLDRFYTGSSDGVLKAWNIRAPPGHELVRDVTQLSGGISVGKFSPDFSKLVIGDSTGKVHILSLDQTEHSAESPIALRKLITPHSPLLAPLIDDDDMEIPAEQTGKEISQDFIHRGQITIHEDEWVGAVQGPNYASTGFFYHFEDYKDDTGQDPEGWSLQELEQNQQLRYSVEMIRLPRLLNLPSSNQVLHQKNITLDLDVNALLPDTYVQLQEARVDLNFRDENDFMFEKSLPADVEDVENSLSKPDQCLDDHEMKELDILRKQICQELKIQTSLQDLF